MPLKERRTIVKKDEKDAGSRSWNAPIVLASFESGCSFLNLRSRIVRGASEVRRQLDAGAARFVLCFCFVVRRRDLFALPARLDHGRVFLPLLLRGVIKCGPHRRELLLDGLRGRRNDLLPPTTPSARSTCADPDATRDKHNSS